VSTTDDRKQEQNLLKAIQYLNGRGIEAGVFGGTNRQKNKKHPSRKRPKKGTPIALYGYVQHEGTKSGSIKPRRWLSGAVDKNYDKWTKMFEAGFDNVLRGSQTMEGLLTFIANIEIVGAIQKSITTLGVIDTGALRMAIRARVVKGIPKD